MKLTAGQEAALKAIAELRTAFPKGGGIAIINGHAGVGKSTMLRTLAEEESLLVLAPTGKAAVRVREAAGVSDARTIHRWLYKPLENPKTGEVGWDRRELGEIEKPEGGVVFVDEASMVTYEMFKDLWEVCKGAGLNLVFIGDGFQLPPVEMNLKHKGWNLLGPNAPCHFRVDMTEVVRQAMDSPIIRASMQIRDLRSDMDALGSDIPVVGAAGAIDKAVEVFNNAGVVLCHRNITRHAVNGSIRVALGRSGSRVEVDEPLLVLFNNYALEAFNGEVLTVDSTPQMIGDRMYPVRDRYSNESMNMGFFRTDVRTVTGKHRVMFADREVFGDTGKVSMSAIRYAAKDLSRTLQIKEKEEISGGWISQEARKAVIPEPVLNANFGYCLSAWKAQGSEWDDVLVLIESSVRVHSEEGRRFLYTCLTRAKKRATICWYG